MTNKIITTLFFVFVLYAAKGQTSTAEQIADRIAQRMKDSLSLTNQQKDSIYSINMKISDWKSSARQQYNANDSLRFYLQVIENRRDSLYKAVLDEPNYLLYKQKKRNLVNNN